MEAPNEKHLENWIIEHFAEFNPSLKILARQLKLPSGILDILALHEGLYANRLCVIELKKTAVDTRAVVQTLRYMNDLRGFYEHIAYELESQKTINWNEFNHAIRLEHHIEGMVVGNSIESDQILYACEASDISVMTYSFDRENYTFEIIANSSCRALDKEHAAMNHPELEVILKEMIFKELRRVALVSAKENQ